MLALNKLHEISAALSLSGIERPAKEAELMIRHVLDIDLVDLYRDSIDLSEKQTRIIDEIVSRRCKREPLQYILEYTGFHDLKIMVGPGVLIPRPETELMAEHAIKAFSSQQSTVGSHDNRRSMILDLCTGSGCLALSLAKSFPAAMVYGTDISERALKYARDNAALNKVGNVEFMRGHLFEALHEETAFDLIISNPPYVRSGDMHTLQPEIKEWEPANALDGGSDGLDFYRGIIPAAYDHINENGILMLELGIGCADMASVLFQESGYHQIELIKDYAGIERIISAHT